MTTKTTRNTEHRTQFNAAFSACEALLNKHPAVQEAVVMRRYDRHGAERTVAYVVPADMRSIETLRADLELELPAQQLPDAWVLLTSVPTTDDGDVDLEKLARFEVLDEDLAEAWKRTLGAFDTVHQVEAIPAERIRRIGSIHRLDLLPGRYIQHKEPAAATRAQPAADTDHRADLQAVPAIVHGESLVESVDEPKTLGEALVRAAQRHGEHGISYVRQDGFVATQSYVQLLAAAEQVLAGLSMLGLRPGDKVIFQLADEREFLTAYWACVLGGMVPALVSIATSYVPTNAAVQRLASAWQLLDRPLVLASDALVSEVQSALDPSGTHSARVQSISTMPLTGTVTRHDARPDDVALILFTSGSTGIPKGVMQSHRSLLCMARGTARQNNFSSRDVTLNWMPMDHVGAISFLHTMPVVLGCRQAHVSPEYILHDPLRWLDLMERFKASISWGPNFAFKLINECFQDMRHRSWDLSSMRFMVSAGELIVNNTIQRCMDLLSTHKLSSSALRPAFGMSETCSGITWSDGYSKAANDAGNPYVDLGAPIPSASLRIVDDQDQVLSEGEIGRLQVKGPSVTSGYYRNPEASAKVFTKDGWFDTGDLGYLRDGHLTLTGREKDEIIINGINHIAAEIEAVVDSVKGVVVSNSAACAVRLPGSETDELAIFFTPVSSDETQLATLLRGIRAEVTAGVGVNPTYVVPLKREEIPKTSIGKIQRTQLRRRFESGEFEALVRQADVLMGINVVPQWFYRRTWRPKTALHRRSLQEGGLVVVFMDARGLGASLCAQLTRNGVPCVAVEAGPDFVRLDRDRYRIDPASAEHYHRLLQAIRESDGQIGRVVHCFTCDDANRPIDTVEALARAQHRGLYSILHLVQALARIQGDAREVGLYMVGSGTQVIAADDNALCTHAAAVGLLKTIPYELNWLRSRHIDLEAGPVDGAAAYVLDEVRSLVKDDEVAYRNGQRFVWDLLPVELTGDAGTREPVRRGGIYLISGGLGGIGGYLVRTLIRDQGIKPILIGTTALPPRSEWPERLEQGGKLAERIRQFLEIEAQGGDFVYEAADVADLGRLREIVAQAEARWGEQLAGVFHLAVGGDVASHWADMERFSVRNETVASFEGMLRAKVYGTWALYRLAQERPGCVVVPFGSVLGLFGAAYFASYCAAHTFQHNFALQQRYREGVRSFSFSWAVWEDIGLSQADPAFAKDFYRSTGYCLIPRDLGYDCMLAGLWRDQPELIVGLDGGKPHVGAHIATQAQPLQGLMAFCVPRRSGVTEGLNAGDLPVLDSYGTASRCEVAWVTDLPVRSDGAVDHQALLAERGAGADRQSEEAVPQTEMERQLAAIWREILPVRRIGVHDSFFQLGGNSLGATRLMSRIRQDFRVTLDMRELFAHATICKLAALVEQKRVDQPESAKSEPGDPLDADALLERVDEMSDSEVAALLASLQSGSGSK